MNSQNYPLSTPLLQLIFKIVMFYRSPSKIKKIKPFKFPSKKEKHEKLKDKDSKETQKEKKKDGEKDKKKDKTKNKTKDKKKQKGIDGKTSVDIGVLYGNYCLNTFLNWNNQLLILINRRSADFWSSIRIVIWS